MTKIYQSQGGNANQPFNNGASFPIGAGAAAGPKVDEVD